MKKSDTSKSNLAFPDGSLVAEDLLVGGETNNPVSFT